MKIQLKVRKLYGKLVYYPLDSLGLLVAGLHRDKRAAKPSFTKKEVEVLKKCGFEVELLPWMEKDA